MRFHGAAVRPDDGQANRQAQAHIAFAVAGRGFTVLQGPVKQSGKGFFRDPLTIVLDGEAGKAAGLPD